MNIFQELEAKNITNDWQERIALADKISTIPTVDIEPEIAKRLKNNLFLTNLFTIISYRNTHTALNINSALVDKIYSVFVKNNYEQFRNFLNFVNITPATLEVLADRVSEDVDNKTGWRWQIPAIVIQHKNFTKSIEDKMVALPKQYSFFYEALAEHSKDEKNILKMAKYIKDSWAFRKVVKKACLSHASLEKLAKIAPEAVAMHSRKLTPVFVDTLAKSKNREIVASAMMNVNMRPETMRHILENADSTKDFRIIRNVAYNKKATLENLTLAFTKMDSGFYNLKEFLKRRDLMEHIQKKLKESK